MKKYIDSGYYSPYLPASWAYDQLHCVFGVDTFVLERDGIRLVLLLTFCTKGSHLDTPAHVDTDMDL